MLRRLPQQSQELGNDTATKQSRCHAFYATYSPTDARKKFLSTIDTELVRQMVDGNMRYLIAYGRVLQFAISLLRDTLIDTVGYCGNLFF